MLVRNGINNNDDNDNDRITNGRIQKSENGFWPQSLANEGLCASWVPVLKGLSCKAGNASFLG